MKSQLFKDIASGCPWQRYYPSSDGKNKDHIASGGQWICRCIQAPCNKENCGFYYWKDKLLQKETRVDNEKEPCRCNCGYTCDGSGRCGLPTMECIEKHWVKDCDHDFTGPWVDFPDGSGGAVTCKHCGVSSIGHDMLCGP